MQVRTKWLVTAILTVCFIPALAQTDTAAVRKAWEDLYEMDQAPRKKLAELRKSGKTMDDPEMRSAAGAVWQADKQSVVIWDSLLTAYGWPYISHYGVVASTAAFLVLQHADMELQQQYLPLLAAAVELGEADASDYCLLLDRILLHKGLPQVFGSQVINVDGQTVFHEIANISKVDKRRAKYGMERLASYAKRFTPSVPLPKGYKKGR